MLLHDLRKELRFDARDLDGRAVLRFADATRGEEVTPVATLCDTCTRFDDCGANNLPLGEECDEHRLRDDDQRITTRSQRIIANMLGLEEDL